jgi:hypothetical protein
MSASLVQRYRRLLWAYPPGERRRELLDTLMECAPPERTRPTAREVVNLLRHGMRARLGRPKSRGVVVLAVFVALACGFLGAAGASRASWETAPSLPTGSESEALKRTVFPGLTVWGGGDAPKFVLQGDGDGVEYGPAYYWVKHTTATRDIGTYTAGVRERLADDGWQIRSDAVDPDPNDADAVTLVYEVAFWASRGDLRLTYTDYVVPNAPAYDSGGAAAFALTRAEPIWVRIATGAGALLGALIGWLLMGWVSRRTTGRPVTGLIVVMAIIGLVFLLPAVMMTQGTNDTPGAPQNEPFWLGFVYMPLGPTLLFVYVGLGALIVAGWPPPAVLRRRSSVLAAVLTVAAVVGGVVWYRSPVPAWAGSRVCTPAVPPAEPSDTRMSRFARVFVSQDSTADQLNLIEAAIGRVYGAGPGNFNRDSLSHEFRQAYCGTAALPQAVGRTLPWFFDVDLGSPGAYDALVAEVQGMPGLVGVRHALPDQ